MKVFISQPMKNREQSEILKERNKAIKTLKEQYDDVEILDNFFEDFKIDENANPLVYLSKSISVLAQADTAMFIEGWSDSRGCIIERHCCDFYDIPVIFFENENVYLQEV